jgi:cyclase
MPRNLDSHPYKPARALPAAIAIAALAVTGGAAWPPANTDAAEIHVLKVQGNIYMLVGPGSNSTVQVGGNGVLVVDTEAAAMSAKMLAVIRQLSDKPIRYIVNTSFDAAHTGGNETLAKAGAPILGVMMASFEGAAILAHENILKRMSAPAGRKAPTPQAAWPTDTYFEGNKELFFNGEAIEIMPAPAAHSDGDSIVFFRRSDVVSTGDIFDTSSYPVINLEAGGNVQGVIDGLNHVLDITIPEHHQEGGTMVIPGHGRLCDEHDVLEYRDMVTIVRDRVQTAIARGLTLEQVKKAGFTKEYDPRYGAASGPWTTDNFVEAVYRSLKVKAK